MLKTAKKMNYKIIEEVLEEKRTSSEKMGVSLGLTGVGFRKAIKKESFKVELLEKMCEKLQVHPLFFLLPNATMSDFPDFDKKKITDILPVNKSEVFRLQTENGKLKDDIIILKSKVIALLERKQ